MKHTTQRGPMRDAKVKIKDGKRNNKTSNKMTASNRVNNECSHEPSATSSARAEDVSKTHNDRSTARYAKEELAPSSSRAQGRPHRTIPVPFRN